MRRWKRSAITAAPISRAIEFYAASGVMLPLWFVSGRREIGKSAAASSFANPPTPAPAPFRSRCPAPAAQAGAGTPL
jgi:hypothetical protein